MKNLNNMTWEEMVFDICAMLKGRTRETRLAYHHVYAMTGGSYSEQCNLTMTESQIKVEEIKGDIVGLLNEIDNDKYLAYTFTLLKTFLGK